MHPWPRNPVVLLLVVILVSGLARPTPATAVRLAWNPALNLSNLAGRSWAATMASSPLNGDLLIAWEEYGLATQDEIAGRLWHRRTGVWTPVQNLSQFDGRDGSPALFFDSDGRGVLLWTRRYTEAQGGPGTDLIWRSWAGAGWSDESALMHRDFYLQGTYGLIPVQTGDAVLLFITWHTSYMTITYQNGVWGEPSGWTFLDVRLGQVLADPVGVLHAAAYGENSSQGGLDPYFYDAYYLSYDGANWSVPVNLSFTDGVADSVGLAFDGQDRLHFFWSDPDSTYSSESLRSAIWERVWQDGAWTPNAEVTAHNTDQAINGFSLAADVSGTLHLAWSEGLMVAGGHTDLDIYYQAGDGLTWGPEEQVYTSTAASRYPFLLTGGDNLSLSWQEIPTTGQDEVYFSCQGCLYSESFRGYLPLLVQ